MEGKESLVAIYYSNRDSFPYSHRRIIKGKLKFESTYPR